MTQVEGPGATPDTPLSKLAGLAHDRLGEMSDVQDARGLAGVVSKSNQGRPRPRWRLPRPLRLVAVAAVVALIATGVAVGPGLLRNAPLTYVMSEGEIQAGGYFQIAARAHPTIRFSDGTQLGLKAGARGRLASVDARGARVMLDGGEAHVEVVPRDGARWLFDAGPFSVQVKGTEFNLAWKADEGRLDVRLLHGAVSVAGPVSDQAISLHAGQWLTVHVRTHEAFVRNLDDDVSASRSSSEVPAPSETIPPAEAPPAAALAPVPVLRDGRPKAHRLARPAPSAADFAWASARAEGDWNRILDAANKRGIDRTLAERSSEDLALLADAAHYLHRDEVAERALLAQRKRFAGTTRAKDAAFLLGRIVESRPGGTSEALDWYDRHLDEAPTGTYASEALGRKMTVLARLRGDKAARPVAEEYLRRYPAGSYARAARAYARKP